MDRDAIVARSDYGAVVFDLDDTLYPESEYLASADLRIANHLAATRGLDADVVRSSLSRHRASGRRRGLFDVIRNEFDLEDEVIAEMLHILRTVDAPLVLFAWVRAAIEDLLRRRIQIFILTNGHVGQQQNKVALLGIDVDYPAITCVFANDHEPKPDPAGLRFIASQAGLDAGDVLFVGDGETDRCSAERAGCDFMHAASVAVEALRSGTFPWSGGVL